MRDQGSKGWDQGSEGRDLEAQPQDQGSQAMGSGSGGSFYLFIYVFFFGSIGDQAVPLLWDQGSKAMELG